MKARTKLFQRLCGKLLQRTAIHKVLASASTTTNFLVTKSHAKNDLLKKLKADGGIQVNMDYKTKKATFTAHLLQFV